MTIATRPPTAGRPARAQDIAQRAGVSLPTVRQILSGRGDRYRRETRERVQALALELGYRPHAGALAISTGRFGCLAMVTSVVSSRSVWAGALWEGMQRRLLRDDYHLAVTCLPDDILGTTNASPKLLREQMADALLINYAYDVPLGLEAAIAQHHIPAVWINRRMPMNAVYPDDFGAGHAATVALLRVGHTKIVYCSAHTDAHSSDPQRAAGYAAAMQSAGLTPRELRNAHGRTAWTAQVQALVTERNRPTAVVGYSPHTLYPLVVAAAQHGLEVPRDLSLATFSDFTANDAGPEISTWIIPFLGVGEAAADLALELVAHGQAQESRSISVIEVTGSTIVAPA